MYCSHFIKVCHIISITAASKFLASLQALSTHGTWTFTVSPILGAGYLNTLSILLASFWELLRAIFLTGGKFSFLLSRFFLIKPFNLWILDVDLKVLRIVRNGCSRFFQDLYFQMAIKLSSCFFPMNIIYYAGETCIGQDEYTLVTKLSNWAEISVINNLNNN